MHQDHKIFIQAIKDKKKVLVQHSNGSGRNTHTEVYRPLFYIPANNQTGCAHYYFWDYKKGKKGDLFRATAKEIVRIGQTHEAFDVTGFTLTGSDDLLRNDLEVT
jgi:hypothetical protein